MQEYLGTAAMQEYGLEIAIARPYNAYGPRDDFDPATSHVIPSLIRRVLAGEDPLRVWGSGNQTRTFLYVKDFVRGLLLCAERYAEGRPVNLGTDEETSIRELVGLCLELTGRRPSVEYDTSRPEGQPRRCCDTTLMKRVLGWEPETSLRDGLAETIRWYQEQAGA
jgi:nucleoside-diphosphate-sugar epimerase